MPEDTLPFLEIILQVGAAIMVIAAVTAIVGGIIFIGKELFK